MKRINFAFLAVCASLALASSAKADGPAPRQVSPPPSPSTTLDCVPASKYAECNAAYQDCKVNEALYLKAAMDCHPGYTADELSVLIKAKKPIPKKAAKPPVARKPPATSPPPLVATPAPTRPAPAPRIVPGPPGPKGDNGADGKDGEDGEDGEDGPAGPQGPAGRDGKDAVAYANLGPGYLATALRVPGKYDAYAAGPSLQLHIGLSKKTALTLEGAWMPGREQGAIARLGVARFLTSWFAIEGGGMAQYTRIEHGKAKSRVVAGTGGIVFQKSWERVSARAEIAGIVGASGYDRFSLAYGGLAVGSLTWRID